MRGHIEMNPSKYEYCPNGNYWENASGIFDNRVYLYCDCKKCNGKLYELRPIDVTNKVSKESLQNAKDNIRLGRVRQSVAHENMEEVAKITKPES